MADVVASSAERRPGTNRPNHRVTRARRLLRQLKPMRVWLAEPHGGERMREQYLAFARALAQEAAAPSPTAAVRTTSGRYALIVD